MAASEAVVDRVHATVAQAAERAIATDRASVDISRLSDVCENPQYDCPVVVLRPENAAAAAVVVEVQDDDLWWLSAGDGPGTELYAGIEARHGDRYALLAQLVRAVVAGRYHHGPMKKRVRRWWRPPIERAAWRETYDTESGPFSSTHFGQEVPGEDRTYAAY